jgi:hypothetical protein
LSIADARVDVRRRQREAFDDFAAHAITGMKIIPMSGMRLAARPPF